MHVVCQCSCILGCNSIASSSTKSTVTTRIQNRLSRAITVLCEHVFDVAIPIRLSDEVSHPRHTAVTRYPTRSAMFRKPQP